MLYGEGRHFVSALLVVTSVFIQAPLEEMANPAVTPHVAKAPWYFLGLQEILSYFNATVAGFLVPTFYLVGLAAIPFIDRTPYKAARDRKLQAFTIGVDDPEMDESRDARAYAEAIGVSLVEERVRAVPGVTGASVTLGLPFPRTSPDHGTALDIAGTGSADASSMRAAIELAMRLAGQARRLAGPPPHPAAEWGCVAGPG